MVIVGSIDHAIDRVSEIEPTLLVRLAGHGTRAVGACSASVSYLPIYVCVKRAPSARACPRRACARRVERVVCAAGDVATVGYTTDKY